MMDRFPCAHFAYPNSGFVIGSFFFGSVFGSGSFTFKWVVIGPNELKTLNETGIVILDKFLTVFLIAITLWGRPGSCWNDRPLNLVCPPTTADQFLRLDPTNS